MVCLMQAGVSLSQEHGSDIIRKGQSMMMSSEGAPSHSIFEGMGK